MKPLQQLTTEAYGQKRRLVSPLVGFPGLSLTHSTIKLAQQNVDEHFKVLKALAERFHPDLIFPLMDLSVEANALGRYTVFPCRESATVPKGDFNIEDLELLRNINIAFDTRLRGVVETVRLMSKKLPADIMKGAYVTGPYSLAALIMGAEDAAMAAVMDTDRLNKLCHFAKEKIQQYIRLLVDAGAEAVCLLEPTAVMLSPEDFEQYSAAFIREICNEYKDSDIAIIYHTCGNTMHLVEKMAGSGVDAVSLDSPEAGVDLPGVADIISSDVVIIGNINPTGTILSGTSDMVREEVSSLLRSMDSYPNFVLSTGCDLPEDVPLENIAAFMQTGREYRIS